MLQIEEATTHAGAFMFGPVSMAMGAGECHALLGPSGAGKSMLLDLVAGFRVPDSGRVVLRGEDAARVPPERRGVGYLPQHLALFPHLTVEDNVLYGLRRKRARSEDVARAAALMDAMGLTPFKARLPSQLSGGERQRAALARALAPSPDLLLLDEPFSALNETLRRELWRVLKNVSRERGVALLMVTHDLDEAYFLGDKVHVLIDGWIHQSGAREDVFNRPATLAAARLLGLENLFPATVTRSGEDIILDVPCLGWKTSFRTGEWDGYSSGESVETVVGIRPEHITMRRPGDSVPRGFLRLRGRVIEVAGTLQGAVIALVPCGARAAVKVAIRAAENAPREGEEMELGIPLRRLFCVSAEASGARAST